MALRFSVSGPPRIGRLDSDFSTLVLPGSSTYNLLKIRNFKRSSGDAHAETACTVASEVVRD